MKQELQRDIILLIEDDREVRAPLTHFLQDLGYDVEVAYDEDESLRLMEFQPGPVKLILVNQRMISDDALCVGRRIRKHVNVESTAPVVVLPSEFRKEMEGTNEKVGQGDYKSYMTSEEQLEDLLATLLNAPR